jgi:hypothetical protein
MSLRCMLVRVLDRVSVESDCEEWSGSESENRDSYWRVMVTHRSSVGLRDHQ